MIKNYFTLIVAITFSVLITTIDVSAQTQVKIRLATLAPRNTTFHKEIANMGEKWKKISNNKVSFTFYTDGQMGSESDMVRRMRANQIQAAMLTVGGLQSIVEDVGALQNMPLVFRDFKVSKKPILSPSDTKDLKLFVTAGDTATLDIVKSFGIKGIPLSLTDILTGLQTGLIDAVPTIPLYALTGQFDGTTKHMTDLNYAPLVGATIIKKSVWNKFTPEQQIEFKKAAIEAGNIIREKSREEADEAVTAMEKRGLQVHKLTPEQYKKWESFMSENVYPVIRGKIVPASKFDQVIELLEEYREENSAE